MDQAPGRKVEMIRVGRWQRPGGRRNALENAQESDFRNRTPERPRRYRFARSLATRINGPNCNNPHQSLTLSAGSLMTEPRNLVLIPARMASTRLPGKPLLDIAGVPMIVHVLRRAREADIGRVAVATDTPEIAAAVRAHGGEAVMTRLEHPSGSDRIFEALEQLDPHGRADIVINLQGDFPTISPDNIRDVLPPLADPAVDIATLAAEIHTEEEATSPNVVKAVGSPIGGRRLRALYFTRARSPHGDGPKRPISAGSRLRPTHLRSPRPWRLMAAPPS